MTDFAETLEQVQSEIKDVLSEVGDEQVDALCRRVTQAASIFVAGRGRSGLQMRSFAMRLMHLGLVAHVVDDVTTPAIRSGDLLIVTTASGRTASILAYVERARKEGAQVALLTVAAQSPIRDRVDWTLHIPAASPKLTNNPVSSLPMASIFEQALGLFLEIVGMRLMDQLGIDEAALFKRHANLE